MWKTILATLESKKFVTGFLAALTLAAGHFGFHVDVTVMLAILTPVMVAIGAQGWADSGKEAAKINAAADAIPPSTFTGKQGGFIGRRVMVGLALFGLAGGPVVIASCAWTKTEAKTIETTAVDCTKGELGNAVKMFSPMLDQLIVLATGGDGHVDTAQLESGTKKLVGDIGGCVLTNSVAKALKPTPAGSGSPQSSPLVVNPDELRAYYEAQRASRFGGKTYVTEQGPL